MGKSSINGPFSMAMLNNQRVPLLFCSCSQCFLNSQRRFLLFQLKEERRTHCHWKLLKTSHLGEPILGTFITKDGRKRFGKGWIKKCNGTGTTRLENQTWQAGKSHIYAGFSMGQHPYGSMATVSEGT